MNKINFNEIFNNDPLNLLDVSTVEPSRERTEDHKLLIDNFHEINEFFEIHHKEPNIKGDIDEFMLASRLQAIRNDPQKVKILLPFDFYNLLKIENTKSLSVNDILKEDPLNLLNDTTIDPSVFKLTHVKKTDRLSPDNIAHRNICKNFDIYEPMFKSIQQDLKNGTRRLTEFSEKDLTTGKFFVLKGILLYLEKLDTSLKNNKFNSGDRVRLDGKTKCIFDNGTESDMLFRSLGKALAKDGFGVSDKIENLTDSKIDKQDVQNGFIYVLKSLSTDPKIMMQKDLYKIGYCTGDVTERIKDAVNEPTYLMNRVQVVLTVRCFNMNVSALESDIHEFFSGVNINFEVYDKKGNKHYPKEWFIAPINVIQDAIQLIVQNKIKDYVYNPDIQMVIKKN